MHRKPLLFSAGAISALVCPLHAELPPEVYADLQRKAAEVVRIRADAVSSEPAGFFVRSPYTETVKATVLRVDRSASGLKAGDRITVTYKRIVPPKGWSGPSPAPKLVKGSTYIAFLEGSGGGTYSIAARGMSFSKTAD